jgi:putative ABC transport system ATP-binding protein
VGFLFQKFHLMPYLTVFDNIRMPLALRGDDRHCADRIAAIAERLKIADRLQHRPDELSVGEQQRVAMARTLATDPQLILADEPTGNLDRANGDIIGECLVEENGKGRIVVLATHDAALMELGRRKLAMESGRVVSDATA